MKLLGVTIRMATLEKKPALPQNVRMHACSHPAILSLGFRGTIANVHITVYECSYLQSTWSKMKLDTNQKPNGRIINKHWGIHGTE